MKLFLAAMFLSMTMLGHAQDFKIDNFDGVFVSNAEGGAMQELWTKINDTTSHGQSVIISANGDTTFLENVLVKKVKGVWYYAPTVTDQNEGKEVLYKLISAESNTYTFENKNHDFPQRIIYSFTDKKIVNARIEGEVKGELRGEDFQFSRK
ncbi:MAG: hypothetical protein IPO27_02500 [Bacteroidetes bacterium]|nr:hypothetical protein [Bacteroidota bacterium]